MNPFVGGKRGRGASEGKNLEKLYKKHGRLDIRFDMRDTTTCNAVGTHANKYKSLIGNTVKRVPFWYDSWADVPDYLKEQVENALRVCILYRISNLKLL